MTAARALDDAGAPPARQRPPGRRGFGAMRAGQPMIRDRLALFSLLGAAIVASLLAVIFIGQFRSLAQHARSVEGLHFGQHIDRLIFAIAREREVVQGAASIGPNLERRHAAARRAVDEAAATLQGFLRSAPSVAEALEGDPSLPHLPAYLARLRTRIDHQVMNDGTAEALYSEAVRQLFRVAGSVEERCVAPGLGARTGRLLNVAMLVDEFSRQSSLLRRIEHRSLGGVLTQERAVLAPLLDSKLRSDHMLAMLASHSDPEVAAQARAVRNTSAHRSIQDFTDKVSLSAWSASFRPRWSALLEDADKLVDMTQESRQRLAMEFIGIAERQAAATRSGMVAVTALGALLVATMCIALWLLYRSIARPLGAIAEAAQAAVAGHLDVSIAYRGQDEVGHLAQALQVLIDTIARFDGEMGRARDGVARGDLTVRADGSRFHGAWRALIDRFNDTLGEFAAVHRLFQRQAFHHPDSGLPNRLGLAHRLAEQGPPHTPCSVFLLLLVRLEDLTATLGADFAAGLVASLARRLEARFDGRYVIAQVSDREFALVCLDAPAAAALEEAAGAIVRACDEPLDHGDALMATPGRVGVATGTLAELDALLTNAAIASRRACQHVRPGYVVHDEHYRLQREKARRIELALPQAIARRELSMVYQPVVDARSGDITGFEALMRWRLPGGDAVPPLDFIRIAEDTGHILALGEMALRTACGSFMQPAVRAAFPKALLSVNVSPRQLMETDFVGTIRDVLDASGLPPRLLALEITESAFMDDPDICIERITALRAMGVHIYLDDFGTGYSSLSYLTRIPVDVLKIDQSFVRGRTGDPANRRIVAAMVKLAHSMGITPLAEGVESAGERDWLLSMGCQRHQGYLYAKPAPIEEHVAVQQACAPGVPGGG
ncbi:EAL domain-containing protein [Aquincola sp. MAHUQ-54]|uniref:EAL domain-containing protein n=1 Tax=Aquincola agrisoli TaxID=3119538 RepID=A0AAW9QDL9_9BURK